MPPSSIQQPQPPRREPSPPFQPPQHFTYDHITNHVSCPTVSGGESKFVEMIFPRAMDSILTFFKDRMEMADQHLSKLRGARKGWALPPVMGTKDAQEESEEPEAMFLDC